MTRAPAVVLVASVGTTAIVVIGAVVTGCFTATSDFDNVAGIPGVDAGDESTSGEDGDAGDGGADAQPWPPLGPVDCTREPHLLCTNFDLAGGLTQGGWIVETAGGGESLLDGARSVSKPASFRSTIPTTTMRTTGILRQTPRVGTWTALRYGFDLFIAACSTNPGGSTTISAMQASSTTAFGVVLDVTNKYVFAQLLLDQGGLFKPHELKRQLVTNKWMRIETRVELSSKATRMQVFIDGEQALDEPGDPRAPGTDILLNLGANASGSVGKCDVNFDNVTFDKE